MISRRTVLAGASGLGVAGVAGMATAQPPARYNLGIQAFTFNQMQVRGDWDAFSRSLETARRIGYDSIELAGLFGHKVDKVRRRCEELGLALHSCHLGNDLMRAFLAPGDKGVAAAQDAVYTPQALVQVVKINAPIARDLGCRWGGIGAIGQSSFASLDSLRRICETFNQCADIAKASGVKFFYHNHALDFQPVQGQTPYELIVAQTVPEVRLQVDVGWAGVSGADGAEIIARHASRIDLVHLRDSDANHVTTTPGEGIVDFRRIHDACRALKDPIFYMEGSGLPERQAIESAGRAYAYLNGLGWGAVRQAGRA